MPKTLIVKRSGENIEIPTKDVQIKDVFTVLAGQLIPVDGKLSGEKQQLTKAF
jgi:cation transport ATPase